MDTNYYGYLWRLTNLQIGHRDGYFLCFWFDPLTRPINDNLFVDINQWFSFVTMLQFSTKPFDSWQMPQIISSSLIFVLHRPQKYVRDKTPKRYLITLIVWSLIVSVSNGICSWWHDPSVLPFNLVRWKNIICLFRCFFYLIFIAR